MDMEVETEIGAGTAEDLDLVPTEENPSHSDSLDMESRQNLVGEIEIIEGDANVGSQPELDNMVEVVDIVEDEEEDKDVVLDLSSSSRSIETGGTGSQSQGQNDLEEPEEDRFVTLELGTSSVISGDTPSTTASQTMTFHSAVEFMSTASTVSVDNTTSGSDKMNESESQSGLEGVEGDTGTGSVSKYFSGGRGQSVGRGRGFGRGNRSSTMSMKTVTTDGDGLNGTSMSETPVRRRGRGRARRGRGRAISLSNQTKTMRRMTATTSTVTATGASEIEPVTAIQGELPTPLTPIHEGQPQETPIQGQVQDNAMPKAATDIVPAKSLSRGKRRSLPDKIKPGKIKIKKASLAKGMYLVEKIIDKRIELDGSPRYLIKWQGYSSTANTWEPKENISEVLISAFDSNRIDESTESPPKTLPKLRLKIPKGCEWPSILTPKPEPVDEGGSQEEVSPVPIIPTPNVRDPVDSVPLERTKFITEVDQGDVETQETIASIGGRFCEPPFKQSSNESMVVSKEDLVSKELNDIHGSAIRDGQNIFLVSFKDVEGYSLVASKEMNLAFPQEVIKYYEKKICWFSSKSETARRLALGHKA